jgi:hypothetical protein
MSCYTILSTLTKHLLATVFYHHAILLRISPLHFENDSSRSTEEVNVRKYDSSRHSTEEVNVRVNQR